MFRTEGADGAARRRNRTVGHASEAVWGATWRKERHEYGMVQAFHVVPQEWPGSRRLVSRARPPRVSPPHFVHYIKGVGEQPLLLSALSRSATLASKPLFSSRAISVASQLAVDQSQLLQVNSVLFVSFFFCSLLLFSVSKLVFRPKAWIF